MVVPYAENCQKNEVFDFFFNFFTLCMLNGIVALGKQTWPSKYIAGGNLSTFFGSLDQILALKMARSRSENCLKNWKIWFLSFTIFRAWNYQSWFCLGLGWGIGICKHVSQCLLMQSRHFGGIKLGSSKKRHFPAAIHKVKSPISSNGKCHP